MKKIREILKHPLYAGLLIASLVSLLFVISGEHEMLFTIPIAYYKHRGPSQPLELLIQQLQHGEIQATNPYSYGYTILNDKCGNEDDPNDIVIIVKTSRKNFKRREAIRKAWGCKSFYKNISVVIVYMVGSSLKDGLQKRIVKENEHHGDILQGHFIDSYNNLTIKTQMGLHWLENQCDHFKYALLVDDDTFISPTNTINYLIDPDRYPSNSLINKNRTLSRGDEDMYAGCLMIKQPIRFRLSKWHVNTDDYPYDYYPPYLNGPFQIMSRFTIKKLYYASLFTDPYM